jgi:hypothetical protein
MNYSNQTYTAMEGALRGLFLVDIDPKTAKFRAI